MKGLLDLFWVLINYIILPPFRPFKKQIYLSLGFSFFAFLLLIKLDFVRNPWINIHPLEAFHQQTTLVYEHADTGGLSLILNLFPIKAIELHLNAQSVLMDSLSLEQKPKIKFSGIQVTGSDRYDWLHVSQIEGDEIQFKSTPYLSYLSTFNEKKIYRFESDQGIKIYLCVFENLLLTSSTKSVVETSVRQLTGIRNSLLHLDFYQGISKKYQLKKDRLHFNLKATSSFLSLFFKQRFKGLDELDRDAWMTLSLNHPSKGGDIEILLMPDSKLSNVFGNDILSDSGISSCFPINLAMGLHLNLQGLNPSSNKDSTFNQYFEPWLGNELLLILNDPIDERNGFGLDKILILHSKDANRTEALLGEFANQQKIQDKRPFLNFEMIRLGKTKVLDQLFGQLLNPIDHIHYSIIGDFVIIANDFSALEQWIKQYAVSNILLKDAAYSKVSNLFKNKHSGFLLMHPFKMKKYLQFLLKDQFLKVVDKWFNKTKNYWPLTIDIQMQRSLIRLNAYADHQKDSIKHSTVSLSWEKKFEKDLIHKPQLLTFKERELFLVQDLDHNIYLLDERGIKKPVEEPLLDGPILSSCYPIDYFDNGEQQYIFNTAKTVYVLDQKGAFIKKLKLVEPTNSGMLLFTHLEKSMLLVSGKQGKLYAFEKNGKPLNIWQNKGKLTNHPIHLVKMNEASFVIWSREGDVGLLGLDGQILFLKKIQGKISRLQVDPTIGRLVALHEDGSLNILNQQGKHFRFRSISNNKINDFLYADVIGDERKDYIRSSSNKIWIQYYDASDGNDRLKEKSVDFTGEINISQLFETHFLENPKTVIGILDRKSSKSYALVNSGKIVDVFPLSASQEFLVSDVFKENRNTLTLIHENRCYNLKIH